MAKSFKEIMNTPVIDILKTPVDTDMSAEGFRRAFGISDYLGKSRAAKRTKAAAEDMKKRVTEKSNVGPGVTVSKTKPKADTVKVTKKETSVETPTGNIGAARGEMGPDMGRINRDEEVAVRDLSSQASDEDIARIAREEDRKSWVDPHEQARRMMGFKKGGAVKKKAGGCGMKSGGSVKSSASRRGDGCAMRGKTKGRIV